MGHGRPNRLQLDGKGPLLLVELENRIGRPAMDRLMIAMAKEPAHTTAIFLRHLTEIAGADADIAAIDPQLGNFSGRIVRDTWVDQAGYTARGEKTGFEAQYDRKSTHLKYSHQRATRMPSSH